MNRIYIPPENILDTEVVLQAEQAHRIRTVLRLRIGDAFVVFDGTGKEYRVKLGRITNREGTATIESITAINRDPKLGITLLQGIPKSDKMDFIVQKTTELGVKQIIPIITERTIPNFTLQKAKEHIPKHVSDYQLDLGDVNQYCLK